MFCTQPDCHTDGDKALARGLLRNSTAQAFLTLSVTATPIGKHMQKPCWAQSDIGRAGDADYAGARDIDDPRWHSDWRLPR